MLNISALIAQQNSLSETIELKLILKLPQRYSIGEILISLMMLAKVELDPLGKISGTASDRFNWCYLQLSGTPFELIDAALYLQILSIEILETEV